MNATPLMYDGSNYTCLGCGESWPTEPRRPWWPIRLRWDWDRQADVSWLPARWSIEMGAARYGQPVMATIYRIGPLRVFFGDRRLPLVDAHAKCRKPFFLPLAGGDA